MGTIIIERLRGYPTYGFGSLGSELMDFLHVTFNSFQKLSQDLFTFLHFAWSNKPKRVYSGDKEVQKPFLALKLAI